MMTTQKQVRAAFWAYAKEVPYRISKRKYRGDYLTDTRVAFVEYVDGLARDGQISEALAQRVTL